MTAAAEKIQASLTKIGKQAASLRRYARTLPEDISRVMLALASELDRLSQSYTKGDDDEAICQRAAACIAQAEMFEDVLLAGRQTH